MPPRNEKSPKKAATAHKSWRHNAVFNWFSSHVVEANGLSGKLLLLTILFVMLAEILTFVPSVANFRRNWLQERLTAAQIAALSAEAAPNHTIPKRLRDELLRTARVHAVALKRNNTRYLVLQADAPVRVNDHYDLRNASWLRADQRCAFGLCRQR